MINNKYKNNVDIDDGNIPSNIYLCIIHCSGIDDTVENGM